MSAELSGKQKCEMLRKIRREIAARNNIAYITSDCTYEGDCPGTCPKCDSEILYLENELNWKIQNGQQVSVAGIYDDLVQMRQMIDHVKAAAVNPADTKEESSSEDEIRGNVLPPMDRDHPGSFNSVPLLGDPFPWDTVYPETSSDVFPMDIPCSTAGAVEPPITIKELKLSPITYIKLRIRGIKNEDVFEDYMLRNTLLNAKEIDEIKEKLLSHGHFGFYERPWDRCT